MLENLLQYSILFQSRTAIYVCNFLIEYVLFNPFIFAVVCLFILYKVICWAFQLINISR